MSGETPAKTTAARSEFTVGPRSEAWGRLLAVLSEAAEAGRLSWREVDDYLQLLERWQELTRNKVWACYQALGT